MKRHKNIIQILHMYCTVLNKYCFPRMTQKYLNFCVKIWCNLSLNNSLIIPVNNVEGGYRNSQRPSVRHSVRLSVRKESPLTATIFHRSLPNFYTMFISLKHFIICSFIKKCQKLLPWQPFFFFTFQAYLPLFLTYMKA